MRYYDYSPMYQHHSFFWQGGLIHILLNALIWGVVIYLIVLLVKKMTAHHGECCGAHDCGEHMQEENSNEYYLDIAKERYAKGEIDKKHYEELKKEFSSEASEVEEIEEEKAKE